MKRKVLSTAALLLCGLFLLCGGTAYAAGTETQAAGEYLREKGVLQGDATGDLMLEKGLNRAELAAILTRLYGNQEHVAADQAYYTKQCTFTDVPEWARLSVGYCAAQGLMLGYGGNRFGSYDSVTPAAACTVTLRIMDGPETDWTYDTAIAAAKRAGITPDQGFGGEAVTRGEMAVLVYRALGNEFTGADGPSPQTGKNEDGSIHLPDGDAKLSLKVGDVVRCDDGTNYTITDMSRYDANAFAAGPLPPLPTATCDWSSFPAVELPAMEVRHFKTETGDFMFVRNLHETRRMQYTLWNLAGNNPETSENGRLKYDSKSYPLVRTYLSIPTDMEPQVFWPWRESEIQRLFESCPIGTYRMEVWDVYGDGVFQHTRYCIDASAQ
ncbi:hypothetical protein SDC9_83832 [bioreactor metagenome]|uniref:SLH domain-containing protein n=1 Tax=bioreactor metagenome TaxID=1076179 RepID=A0A644Z8J7_9ZZZZ